MLLDSYPLLSYIRWKAACASSRLMFSSERRRRFGLPGDIFRKLYPRPPRCEFSGQSRMIPQIHRFRSSTSKELQLQELNGWTNSSSWIFVSLWNVWLRKRGFWATRIDAFERKIYERQNPAPIKTCEIYSISIYEFVELKLVFKLYLSLIIFLTLGGICSCLDRNLFSFSLDLFARYFTSENEGKVFLW